MCEPEESGGPITVEVVHAAADALFLVQVSVPRGATVLSAIVCSGILDRYPDIDVSAGNVGIFGRIVASADAVGPGDRVEIYRPLLRDPREQRRRRAVRQARRCGRSAPPADEDRRP